jgi:cellulose synthase/poly-beta-1,6-N-acetylglucosamine synthase-like glycosyltransferase
MNPAFIRKKYVSFKDEAMLQKKSGAYFENKKRITAIRNAIKTGTNVAILDDGFQHFSINKDLSIVCFTEKQWKGNGLTIPSGPLRESMSALNRANYVVINGNQNIKIEKQILKNNKNIKIFQREYDRGLLQSIKFALQSMTGEYFGVMDADRPHAPTDINLLVSYLDNYDLVIGVRDLKKLTQVSAKRSFLSKLFNKIIKLILSVKISDPLTGFFAGKISLLNSKFFFIILANSLKITQSSLALPGG